VSMHPPAEAHAEAQAEAPAEADDDNEEETAAEVSTNVTGDDKMEGVASHEDPDAAGALGTAPTAASAAKRFADDSKSDKWLFRTVDPTCESVLRETYGLSAAFPMHLVITRSELSKSMLIVSEAVRATRFTAFR